MTSKLANLSIFSREFGHPLDIDQWIMNLHRLTTSILITIVLLLLSKLEANRSRSRSLLQAEPNSAPVNFSKLR